MLDELSDIENKIAIEHSYHLNESALEKELSKGRLEILQAKRKRLKLRIQFEAEQEFKKSAKKILTTFIIPKHKQ